MVGLNGNNEEEVGEEEAGLAGAPLPSAFLHKNASGLDRKQEARAESEGLGGRPWPAEGYRPGAS